MNSSFDPEFPHIEINPEEIIQQVGKDICARIFMAVIFMVVQNWKLCQIKIKFGKNIKVHIYVGI